MDAAAVESPRLTPGPVPQALGAGVLLLLMVFAAWRLLDLGWSLPAAGLVMFVLPSTTLTMAVAVYAHLKGQLHPPQPRPAEAVSRPRATLAAIAFTCVLVLLAVGLLRVADDSSIVRAVWLGIASSLVTVCSARWLREMLDHGRPAAAVSSDTFTRRTRILLFAFVVGAPLGFAVVFLQHHDVQASGIYALVGLGALPWALRKAHAEWRRPPRAPGVDY